MERMIHQANKPPEHHDHQRGGQQHAAHAVGSALGGARGLAELLLLLQQQGVHGAEIGLLGRVHLGHQQILGVKHLA
jgi:hypothetical protein